MTSRNSGRSSCLGYQPEEMPLPNLEYTRGLYDLCWINDCRPFKLDTPLVNQAASFVLALCQAG